MKLTIENEMPELDLLGDEIVTASESGVVHSLGTLAAEFGRSRDVLRRVVSEAGIAPVSTQSGRPLYRLRDVIAAVIGEQDPEQLAPHARHALAKAILTEDEIKVRRGELLLSGDVERKMAEIFMMVRRTFEIAPDNLERDIGLSGLQADRLVRHFDDALEELYKEFANEDENENRIGGDDGNDEGADRTNHDDHGGRPKSSGRVRQKKVRKRRSKQKS